MMLKLARNSDLPAGQPTSKWLTIRPERQRHLVAVSITSPPITSKSIRTAIMMIASSLWLDQREITQVELIHHSSRGIRSGFVWGRRQSLVEHKLQHFGALDLAERGSAWA